MRKMLFVLIVVFAGANLSGCGYNKLQNQDESVKAAWSEVVNQYQRRADLVPNLVATVKGFAAQEERVLVGVTEARAKATSIQLTPELINDPVAFQKFQESQAQLTSALKTLLATVEAYPDLKSSASFRDLAAQLEGTENRISVARNRYIDAVREYNVTVREFPTNLTAGWFDFEVKPNFTVQNEAAIAAPPAVSFDGTTPSQPAVPNEPERATPPGELVHVKALLLPVAFALIAGFAPRAPAQVALPRFEALVTDLTGTLTAAQQSALEAKLRAYQARKGAQIAVLVLPTTEPEDIAQFGIRLADAWKVGRKGPDDGVIFIVAKDDRTMRMEVGYGLEGALTDATTSRIINDTIAPLFKQGDFYGGVNAGLDQMMRIVDGEALPAPDQSWEKSPGADMPWPVIGFALIAFGSMLSGLIGRLGSAAMTGLVGAGIVGWVTSQIGFAIGAFVALFVLTLLFGGAGGSGRGGRGGRGVFRDIGRGGGFGGGFGRGGGGFGGGGGGGFGGGGASGRW